MNYNTLTLTSFENTQHAYVEDREKMNRDD